MPFFETLLAREGIFPYLPWHQARLERTLREHGVTRFFQLSKLLTPPDAGTWRCRVVYDEHQVQVEYLPYAFRPVQYLQAIENNAVRYRFKTTWREALNALYALRGNADDVLIVQHGLLTDTTIANVACWIDGAWLTPRRPLLEGTARARLLHEGKIHEADIPLKAAMQAERVAVMNALSGFVEVAGGILRPKKGGVHADQDSQ